MAGSVNRVHLVGNLGKDVEVAYSPAGMAAATLSVATHEKWKNKQGEPQERTEWHRVNIFGETATNAAKYLRKGSQVYVEGSLRTREWIDKSGSKRYTTEITCQRLVYLQASEGGASKHREVSAEQPPVPGGDDEF